MRELELRHLLDRETPDVVVLTETELDKNDDSITIPGYKIFCASPSHQGRVRVLLLLRNSLALPAPPTLLAVNHQEIWLKLPCASGSWTIAAVYRQWSNDEAEDVDTLCNNARGFSSSRPYVAILGDLNFNIARRNDPSYYRRALLRKFMDVMEELGFKLENDMIPTYRSHGFFGTGGVHRKSVLDLVLTLGVAQRPIVRVLPDAVTDHHPVAVLLPVSKSTTKMRELHCHDFERVSKPDLLMHINAARLSEVFFKDDVDKIASILVREITEVLNLLAPLKKILVKDSTTTLYLQKETRNLMAARDQAAQRKNWTLFRKLRNQTACKVRQDRLASNMNLLNRCQGDSKRVCGVATCKLANWKGGGNGPSSLARE